MPIGIELMDIAQRKRLLRREILSERLSVPSGEAVRYSAAIVRELEKYVADRRVVCSYAAFRGEVDLAPLHGRIIADNKILLLPRVEGGDMRFYEVRELDGLVRSKLGILEPDPSKCRLWSDEEVWNSNPLVITPGVAFALDGSRVGYGGGFYDRFFALSKGRGTSIGVCFRVQLRDELLVESHDARVRGVVYAPKKVILGLSGGVDSAVAALMLKEQGYDVTGLWLNMCKNDSPSECGGSQECRDAEKIAETLGIGFVIVDKRNEFRNTIVEYFIGEYLSGRTPNPCIHCNRLMKFKSLLDYADGVGAEYIATGHYAKIRCNESGRYEVVRPLDSRKDQTYMLARLTQEQLARVLMPLADVRDKSEVRRMAAELGLHISEKKDSQEICFVDENYLDFLHAEGAHGIKGHFLLDGKRVRRHDGIENYTIGQRRGLGSFGMPVFVVDIDPGTGDVILGSNDDIFGRSLEASGLNYVAVQEGREIGRCDAKIRYASPLGACNVTLLGEGRVRVDFDKPQRAITPGQSVVFYRNGVVLGSAVIERKICCEDSRGGGRAINDEITVF